MDRRFVSTYGTVTDPLEDCRKRSYTEHPSNQPLIQGSFKNPLVSETSRTYKMVGHKLEQHVGI